MREITVPTKAIHTGSLILVNRAHPLRKQPQRESLCSAGKGMLLEREAASQLKALLGGTKEIVGVSGFRSREEQKTLYETSLMENGERFTKKYVTQPQCSEHESGLAVDLGENRQPVDFIRPSFPYRGVCQDFRRQAPFFGFIQRYGREKESVTGIAHEPWHFRYVGFPHSLIIEEENLSLEEYLHDLRQRKTRQWKCGVRVIEILHIKAAEAEQTRLRLPEERTCRISGDNVDGFVFNLL